MGWLNDNMDWLQYLNPGLMIGNTINRKIDLGHINNQYFNDREGYAQDMIQRGEDIRTQAGDRPMYEIPQEVLDVVNQGAPNIPDMPTLTKLPGSDIMKQQLDSNTAQRLDAIKEMTSGGAGIGALADMGVENRNRLQDLAIKNASFAADNANRKAEWDRENVWNKTQYNLNNKLRLAEYKDRAFNINEMEPWNIAQNRADNYEFAGQANYWNNYGDRVGVANENYQAMIDRYMSLLNMGANIGGKIAMGV